MSFHPAFTTKKNKGNLPFTLAVDHGHREPCLDKRADRPKDLVQQQQRAARLQRGELLPQRECGVGAAKPEADKEAQHQKHRQRVGSRRDEAERPDANNRQQERQPAAVFDFACVYVFGYVFIVGCVMCD